MRLRWLIVLTPCFPLLGCATLFGGGGRQTVRIVAQPQASFVVRTAAGEYVTAGVAPADVTLSRKRDYLVEFNAPGHATAVTALTRARNGWFKANYTWFIGGILVFIPIGIDAATGARWKLEPSGLAIALDSARTP